ncbi:hypothetical protein CSB20_14645 [bacterium DOLZORAL124_64_63]|nr:MAG: hypothetical protein CSB20_14645 [bacterium DOLZORAL124_64_63]
MKMTKHSLRNLAGAALIVFLVAGATMAMAQRGSHEQKMKRGWLRFDGPENRIEMLARRLDLTHDQKAAIEKIHAKNRQDAVGLRKDLSKLVHELRGEMMQDNPSQKKALDLNRKIGQIKTELEALRLQGRLAIRRQLTDEQRDKMILMGGPGKGRGPGRGGPRGMRGLGDPEGRCGEGPGFLSPRGEDAPKADQ